MDAAATVSVIFIWRQRENSSQSETSSDEEWEAILQRKAKSRRLQLRIEDYTQKIIAQYDEKEFKSHFRLSRTTFEFLLTIIGNDLQRKIKGHQTIPLQQQLLIALWKMGTNDSYRSICVKFNVGKATALRAVRVCSALFRRTECFIKWLNNEQARIVMHGFQEASTFPKIIGAIDGTHIGIVAPKANTADYINRKGYPSIHLQVVCDHRALITHCYTGHPGSVHDRVFRLSEVADFLTDCAYGIHQHLLVPFKDNGHLLPRQRNFNFCLSSARMVVERCFALLKGRMRSLLHCLPMQRIDLMAEYIVACSVIHNICIMSHDELIAVNIPNPRAEENERENLYHARAYANPDLHKRNMLTNALPLRIV